MKTLAASEVAFELDRFAWREGAFEVAGRWRADQACALGRARLCVELAGRRHRLAPESAAPVAAAPSGEPWSVRFAWPQEPAALTRAELEVGRRLAVELPLPRVSDRRFARTPGDGDGLPAEIERARSDVMALLEQLQGERTALSQEIAALTTARDQLVEEREQIAAQPRAQAAEPSRRPRPASGELFAGHAPWVLRAFALGLVALLLLALGLIVVAML